MLIACQIPLKSGLPSFVPRRPVRLGPASVPGMARASRSSQAKRKAAKPANHAPVAVSHLSSEARYQHGLEREPSAYLSDTRVIRLDVRVIAEVGIRYTEVRTAKDHSVQRILRLETDRETHAFAEVDFFLEKRVEVCVRMEYRRADMNRGAFPKAYVPVCLNAAGLKSDSWPACIHYLRRDVCRQPASGASLQPVLREADCMRRCERKGLTRVVLVGAAKLPASKDLAGQPMVEKLLLRAQGKLVQGAHPYNVGLIQGGDRPLAAMTAIVLNTGAGAGFTNIIDVFAVGIAQE